MMTSPYHQSALATERRREVLAQADAARLARHARAARRQDKIVRSERRYRRRAAVAWQQSAPCPPPEPTEAAILEVVG